MLGKDLIPDIRNPKHALLTALCLLAAFLSSCTSRRDSDAQRLNDMAFSNHYRSLAAVRTYADSVLADSRAGADERAEALNNLAYYYTGKMRYAIADSLLDEVEDETDNNIELCIADIQRMRLCQRRSYNKAFYEYRQNALSHLKRINEENGYTQRQQHRIMYAEIEFRLVSSVYEYYVGRISDAIASLRELDSIGIQREDTAQTLAYLYNIGAGGILTQGTKEEIEHQEYDYLLRCYTLAAEGDYTYWQANALQAIAEHIIADKGHYLEENPATARYVNIESVADSLLAGNAAERSLQLFRQHGDVYQQAASWRVLSTCYRQLGDFPGALYSLQEALKADTALHNAPALMASIYELFSISYSAINEKKVSDYYRNHYLDLYENTRQDRQLEARADQVNTKVRHLRVLLLVIIAVFLLLTGLLLFLVIRRQKRKDSESEVSGTMQSLYREYKARLQDMDDGIEELEERVAMTDMQKSRQEELYAENRARMHLINSLIPLLDRMLHETGRLARGDEDSAVREARKEYIAEIISGINTENNFLTRWIQLKQGSLSLHIETFRLQDVFSIVAASAPSFRSKGIALDVVETAECVKADRTLTLFMLNTICDNARKHSASGGTVSVCARPSEGDMVEISISDNGSGMTARQQATLFDVKAINDEAIENGMTAEKTVSHGFGLANCKGIIEKYKKTNTLFAKCEIGVESTVGEGTRIFFRLPSGVRQMLSVITVLFLLPVTAVAGAGGGAASDTLADSVYNANISGRYADAVIFARRYMEALNAEYRRMAPSSRDTLMLNDTLSTVPAEMRWISNGINAPYNTILSVRNELAVAALALHDWDLYEYNNAAYSQLFRIHSADNTLEEYCKRMETTETDSNIAVILLVMMLLSLVPIYYFAYYKHVITDVMAKIHEMRLQVCERAEETAALRTRLEKLEFEHDRLHVANNVLANSFSAIKHETMYYPSRISQLLQSGDEVMLDEVARYYRTIYGAFAAQAQYNSRRQLSPDALRDIMLRTMARISKQRKADLKPTQTAPPYLIYEFDMPPASVNNDNININMRILTQVVRDLGELYNMRRCGIVIRESRFTVTAPEE